MPMPMPVPMYMGGRRSAAPRRRSAPRKRSFTKSRLYRKMRPIYRRYRRFNRYYPSSKYGMQAIPRTDETRAAYGASWKSATPEQREARKNDRYYGRGAYGIRRTLGGWLKRNKVFSAGNVAKAAGLGMRFAGMGAYNDLFTGCGAPDSTANITSVADEQGGIIISHREYIGDIIGTTDKLKIHKYDLNPGIAKLNPWLAQLAPCWQEYQYLQLVFECEPAIGEVINSSGHVGEVLCTTQYKLDAPPPTTKADFVRYPHSTSGMLTDRQVHGVECDPSKLRRGSDRKYVRSKDLTPDQDPDEFDHATFYIGIYDCNHDLDARAIVSVYVTYTVKLVLPIQNPDEVNFYAASYHYNKHDNTHSCENLSTSRTYSITAPSAATLATFHKSTDTDAAGGIQIVGGLAASYKFQNPYVNAQLNSWVNNLNSTGTGYTYANNNFGRKCWKLTMPPGVSGALKVRIKWWHDVTTVPSTWWSVKGGYTLKTDCIDIQALSSGIIKLADMPFYQHSGNTSISDYKGYTYATVFTDTTENTSQAEIHLYVTEVQTNAVPLAIYVFLAPIILNDTTKVVSPHGDTTNIDYAPAFKDMQVTMESYHQENLVVDNVVVIDGQHLVTCPELIHHSSGKVDVVDQSLGTDSTVFSF